MIGYQAPLCTVVTATEMPFLASVVIILVSVPQIMADLESSAADVITVTWDGLLVAMHPVPQLIEQRVEIKGNLGCLVS